MLELALLGVQPDGHTLTLNDDEGNRYTLPITDELRAALRRDRAASSDTTPKPMSPKEIQAHFRSGLSLEEVSDLTNMPVSQLSPFEFPIRAEREYTAQKARSFRIGHEIGGLTVEELVTSRLRSRQVSPSSITWDAVKEIGGVWKLKAIYPAGGRETTAVWNIDMESGSLHAQNDEATWLSETEIPAKDAPWRPVSQTRRATPEDFLDSADSPDSTESSPSAESAQSPAESRSANAELVSMLDGLNSRRGQQRPAPTFEDEEDLPPAAHPAASAPEEATDATVLSLPQRKKPEPQEDKVASPAEIVSPASAETAEQSDKSALTPIAPDDDSLFSEPQPKKKPKKRSGNRPAMPSWDEIVFGHPKKD